jgi:TonB family protein
MDVLGNFVQRVIEACLFFNPWVYVIGRQLIKEREAACDDWALEATRDPGRYASCLSQVAQAAARSRTFLLTPSAIGSNHMLLGRIARVLNGKAGQLKINYFVLVSSIISFAILGVLLQAGRGLASPAVSGSGPVGMRVAQNSCNAGVKPLNAAAPNIPKPAYQAGVSAGALVMVDADGRPTSAKIVKSSGNAVIDRATVNAAMASTYSPAVRSCKREAGMYLFQVETGPLPSSSS